VAVDNPNGLESLAERVDEMCRALNRGSDFAAYAN
jgi:hypothetical protein